MKDRTIFALGFFDGVPLGHQALLNACKTLAEQENCAAGVITFASHPDTLVLGNTPALLSTAEDRAHLLEGFGIQTVMALPFDKTMMEMPWKRFFRMVVEDYHAAGIVCGNDFRFGYRGEGNAELLRRACEEIKIPCIVVPEQTVNEIRVSSTYIRTLVESGEMKTAVQFFGHPHLLTGTVVSGRKLGRTMGIPTANVRIPAGVVMPKHGVYVTSCQIGEENFAAVTNIGHRPTVDGHEVRAESWLLDFTGDLYGKNITLQFYDFLRPERKFDSLISLKEEIQKNAEEVRKFFAKT